VSDANREVCIRLNQEVFGRGRVELVDELLTEDFRNHASPPGAPDGRDGIRGVVGFLHGALDDLDYTIEDTLADGDRVALRVTMSGTHTGDFFGVPPTGRRFEAQQIHIFRMADGKVAEHWAVRDDLGMLRQLGASPA
jgi:steroid delta-isomerase-like uncharacterized protein